MARGDGKAVKGRTKGKTLGVKRMATGGFAASTRDGGFGGAGVGRLESPGQRSSVSPGAGNISAGRSPGGDAGNRGGDRQTPSAKPSGASPAGQMARLGPNAAAAMTQAGINSGRAQMLAGIMNDLQDTRPASIRGTEIQSLTPGGKIADRIEPTMGYIPQPTLRGVPQPQKYPGGRLPGYIDQQSIVPGTVSFKQAMQQVPFAETPTGKSLLGRSKQPLTKAEAEALAKQLPSGTQLTGNFTGAGLFGYGSPKNPSDYIGYPATIEGRSFTVNVPKSATGQVATGPKIGTWNPAPAPAAPKAFTDRIPAEGTKQFYDRLPQERAASPRATPAAVVAGPKSSNFAAAERPFGRRDRDDRPMRGRKKKKPIVEETTAAKNGGLITRGDGKASRGKTKGRYI